MWCMVDWLKPNVVWVACWSGDIVLQNTYEEHTYMNSTVSHDVQDLDNL
jgi:hypothetical protein